MTASGPQTVDTAGEGPAEEMCPLGLVRTAVGRASMQVCQAFIEAR